MTKIKRSRNGCFTCKERRRKCDETKPSCVNCSSTGRNCSYGIKLSFDVDDSRHSAFLTQANGQTKYGFRGRPRREGGTKKTVNTNHGSTAEPAQTINSTPSGESLHTLSPKEGIPQQLQPSPVLQFRQESDFSVEDTFDFLHMGLDYLLNGANPTREIKQEPILPATQNSSSLNTNSGKAIEMPNDMGRFEDPIEATEIMSFIDNTNLYPPASLSYSDENAVLRHFFNRLLPLLDSHPNNPWPELALKYCDFEIARSCFLSLSCIHLYGRKGGNEFYKTGMRHINSTMDYLIKYVNKSGASFEFNAERKYNDEIKNEINVDSIVGDLKQETINQKRSSFFVILILIYVHILFSILESGKSVLSRIFFKLFATIANDNMFKAVLEQIDQSQTFICILSWYDTITAVSSPDCRLPYCDPRWYGKKNDQISLAKMVGCPGEIFECIADICHLRRDLRLNKLSRTQEITEVYKKIKFKILDYRDYVPIKLNQDADDSVQLKPEDDYNVRLRGAQCWSLSALVKLESILNHPESSEKIEILINEFIMVYGSMDPECSTVVQMVWPIFNIAGECKLPKHRESLKKFIDLLNLNGQTGTLRTLRALVEESWRSGVNMDEILSGKDWLESGKDFLPL